MMRLIATVLPKTDSLIRLGVNCPFCGFPFHPGDRVIFCPNDNTPHHAACWQQNGNHCTLLGCTGAGEIVIPATPRRLAPFVLGSIVTLCLAIILLYGLAMMSRPKDIMSVIATRLADTPTSIHMPTTAPASTNLPVLVGTPVPLPVSAISPENANRVIKLARWEREGVLNEGPVFNWSPRGQWFTVRSNHGLRLYTGDNFRTYRLVETGSYPVISPDETLIASAVVTSPSVVRIVNLHNGQVIREWQPHRAPITALWFAENILFSQDKAGTICAHDITANPPRLWLQVDNVQGRVYTSADGKSLIEVDTNTDQQPPTQRIRVCNVSTGKCETGNQDLLGGLLLDINSQFTQSNAVLLVLKKDGTLVTQTGSGDIIAALGTFTDSKKLVHSSRLSPRASYVWVDGIIWDAKSGKVAMQSESIRSAWSPPQFSPDERYLSGFEGHFFEGHFFLVDLRAQRSVPMNIPYDRSRGSFSITRPVFRADGQRVAAGVIGLGGQIGVFNTNGGQTIGKIDVDLSTAILGLKFDGQGQLWTVSGAAIQMRGIPDGRVQRDIANTAERDFALSESGVYLRSSGTASYRFMPYDSTHPSREFTFVLPPISSDVQMIRIPELGTARTTFFAFDRNNRYLVQEQVIKTSEQDNASMLILYTADSPKPIRTFTLPGTLKGGLTFTPDGSFLAAAYGNRITLLRVPELTIASQLEIEQKIRDFHFSPNSEVLAVSGEGGKAYLWLWQSRTLYPLETKSEESGAWAFSPDGKLVALVVRNGIQLWDVTTRRLLRTLDAPKAFSVTFSPDQRLLAAGTLGETVFLYGIR